MSDKFRSKFASLFAGASAVALTAASIPAAEAGIYRDDVGEEGAIEYAAPWDGVVQIFMLNNTTGGISFNCTGSMINARTVLSAAHCFNSRPSEAYGPGAPGFTPIVAYGEDTFIPLFNWIDTNQQFMGEMGGLTFGVDMLVHPTAEFGNQPFPAADVAMIALQDPLYSLPTYSMLFSPVPEGSIEDGLHVVKVGYGGYGPGSLGDIDINGKRRAGENMLGLLGSQNDFIQGLAQNEDAGFAGEADNQLLYWTDFDLPGRQSFCERGTAFGADNSIICSDWDGFTGVRLDNDTIVLPDTGIDYFPGDALPNEFTTAGGDSGGPLIADELGDMPFILGVLSGGFIPGIFHEPNQAYGEVSYYNPLFTSHQFITENNPYKYVSAMAGDGNWSDPTHWVQTLDPTYWVYDENGDLVNGIPDGDEGGTGQTRPIEGIVFDTPVEENDGNDEPEETVPDVDDPDSPAAGIESALSNNASEQDTGLVLGGSTTGIGGSIRTGNASDLSTGLTADIASSEAVDLAPGAAEVSTLTGVEQSLTGPGSTDFVPNNFYGQRGELFANPAQFFEVTLAADGWTTLDLDVEIDKLTIDGPNAGLDIASDWELVSNINAEIYDGYMNLDGNLVTRELVMWGGTLTGSGSMSLIDLNAFFGNGELLSGTFYNLAGMVSPGDMMSTGTLTIGGDYVQASAGAYIANITPGGTDLLDVSGSASLAGLLGLQFSAMPTFGDTYTVLTAGGDIVGGFDMVSAPQLDDIILTASSSVGDGAVSVEIEAGDFRDFLDDVATDNQLSIATSLQLAREDSYSDLSDVYDVVDYLPAPQLAMVLNELAPDEAIIAGNMLLGQGDLVVSTLAKHRAKMTDDTFMVAGGFDTGRIAGVLGETRVASAASGAAAFSYMAQDSESGTGLAMSEGWSGFADIAISEGDVAGLEAFDTEAMSAFTLSAGLERAFTERFSLGLSGHYLDSDTEMDDGGVVDSEGYTIAVYGDFDLTEKLSLGGYAGGGQFDLETERMDAVFGAATMNSGETEAEQVLAGLELVYDYVLSDNVSHLRPKAGLHFAEYDIEAYEETGGQATLAVDEFDVRSIQAKVGVDFVTTLSLGDTAIRPFIGTSIVSELVEDTSAVQASFTAAPGTPFYVTGPDADATWYEPQVGVEVQHSDWLTFSADFSTQYGRDDVSLSSIRIGGTAKF